MRTIAVTVSHVLLGLFLILLGAVAIALMFVWVPLGAGTIAAGIGARILHEIRDPLQ